MPFDIASDRQDNDASPSWRLIFGDPKPREGDTIVHLDYGIGRLKGIEEIDVDGCTLKTARLQFANDASLMVPEAEFDKLWTYGAGDGATLDALDGTVWQDRLAEARSEIAQTARALITRAKDRHAAKAPEIQECPARLGSVTNGFPHDLTDDQERADRFTARDLGAGFPMDRLVIGDVGYGKTEIMIRAAARVALSGYQVAIAVPTTVLCRQITEALRDRLGAAGLEVGELSRLVPDAARSETRKALREGSLKVVVGTSVLASRPVRFSNLGLVIVDEEHRFGAKAKAALDKYAKGAHRLTLTATPIPRALTAAEIGVTMATAKWSARDSAALLGHWNDAHRLLLDDLSYLHNALILRYEDVVADPARSFARVFRFMELAPHLPDLDLSPAVNDAYFEAWPGGEAVDTVAAQFGYGLHPPETRALPLAPVKHVYRSVVDAVNGL